MSTGRLSRLCRAYARSLQHNPRSYFRKFSSHEDARPPRRPPDDELRYLLQRGKATDTLRSELPHFFQRGLITDDIYSPSMLYYEPHYVRFCVKGKQPYLTVANLTRWMFRLLCSEVNLEILKMKDDKGKLSSSISEATATNKHRDELTIRWRVRGWLRLSSKQPLTLFEGTSIYVFDERGMIKEHRIEHVSPVPTKLMNVSFTMVYWWQRRLSPCFMPFHANNKQTN